MQEMHNKWCKLVYDDKRMHDPIWNDIIAAGNTAEVYAMVHEKHKKQQPHETGDSYHYAVVHRMDRIEKLCLIKEYYLHMMVPGQTILETLPEFPGDSESDDEITEAELLAASAAAQWSAKPQKRQCNEDALSALNARPVQRQRTKADNEAGALDAFMKGIGTLGN